MASQHLDEEAIFKFARKIGSPGDRDEYLQQVCRDDRALLARVEALLEVEEKQPQFLNGPPSGVNPTIDTSAITERAGTVIGKYTLREQIGEGGFGIVYVAEQTKPVRRKVALKIIKPGMDTKDVIARFEGEQQALALMDHPNIAHVLDAGATDSGRPYFVMELVQGVPINEFCDKNNFSTTQRLELFMDVCHAVQHAHHKGIIHRDLKPNNILVTLHDGRPVPKVIDFGVAKALSQQLTERTIYTSYGQMIGTPVYMSPEQAEMSGLGIDTRSDIYSLGVLLYELLVGKAPLDAQRLMASGYGEMLRIIREEEPPRPSTKVSTLGEEATVIAQQRGTDARKLRQSLSGELDWIVIKALEKDRSRRYDTANNLAADIGRFLRGEAVEACPPSAGYLLRKFARRNRVALVTTTVVALAMVLGTVISTSQAIKARRAEGKARSAERRARSEERKANGLLTAVTLERNRVQELLRSETEQRDVADRARQEADRRLAEAQQVVDFLITDMIGAAAPSQTQGTMPTVDRVLAQADARIGEQFGDRPLIEASIRHALGKAYVELGESAKAEQHAARAVALRQEHLGHEHVETIAAQNALGWALYMRFQLRKHAEARTLMTKVLATARQALGSEHEETLRAMNVLGAVLDKLQQDGDAYALIEESMTIKMRVLGPEHEDTLAAMHNVAFMCEMLGEPEKAKRIYEEALDIASRTQPNHPLTFSMMNHLARTYGRLHEHDRALDLKRRAVDGLLHVLGLAHPRTRKWINEYVNLSIDQRKFDEARILLEQTLERSRRERGPGALETVTLMSDLAKIRFRQGNRKEARTLLQETRDLAGQLPKDWRTLDVMSDLAEEFQHQGDTVEALALHKSAAEMQERALDDEDPNTPGIVNRLALRLRELGQPEEAKVLLERVSDLAYGELDPDQSKEIENQRALARMLLRRWRGPHTQIGPEEVPLTVDAPFKSNAPVADGRIGAEEYGPGLQVRVSTDGNIGRLWQESIDQTKSLDDLSFQIFAAHTDSALFLAFQVRDQFIDAQEEDKHRPYFNDAASIFINGDLVANDHTLLSRRSNREGFQLVADVLGHQHTSSPDISNEDWSVGTSTTLDGYIIEFEVPLSLIDTQDGPEFTPAATGSFLLFNASIDDNDELVRKQTNQFLLWSDDPVLSLYSGGEDMWMVGLRLTPAPQPATRISSAGKP